MKQSADQVGLGELTDQRDRLIELRRAVAREREMAASPALDQALGQVDAHLFLALSYLGYTEELFPGSP